ncbi:hypothetical protein BJ165DRAFT_861786 [Panaeolus papilionaceus]|nr:hypothetical protein BJ165DRAFT_861786 [Panaeolus papilionaceus]
MRRSPCSAEEYSAGSVPMFRSCLEQSKSIPGIGPTCHNLVLAAAHLREIIHCSTVSLNLLPRFSEVSWLGLGLGPLKERYSPQRPLWFATMVSPIFLLSDLCLMDWSFTKQQLLVYSSHLPMHKPAVIVQFELVIWRALFVMATGQEQATQTVIFLLDKLSSWTTDQSGLACVKDWFSIGRRMNVWDLLLAKLFL